MNPFAPGWQLRLRQAIIAIPLIAVGCATYVLARSALLGSQDGDAGSYFSGALIAFGLFALLFGVVYTLWGNVIVRVSWATVFASTDLGMLLGAILYLSPLSGRLLPPSDLPRSDNLSLHLAAVGMLDGALLGVLNGLVVGNLDAKPTDWSFTGVVRFVCISSFVVAALLLTWWIDQSSHLGDIFSPLCFVLMYVLIQQGIKWMDRKAAARQ